MTADRKPVTDPRIEAMYRATMQRFWRTPADDVEADQPVPDLILRRRLATENMITAIRRLPKEGEAA